MSNLSYILCRPQGGLNDSLVQIEKCCRYGERYGRAVVVDTNYWCSQFFRDNFSNYFVSKQSSLFLDYDSAPDDLNSLSVFPPSLKGRLTEYKPNKAETVNDKGRFELYVDETGTPIALNSHRIFSERVLVDHALGGGTASLSALSRMKLHSSLTPELSARLSAICGSYTSIHIRNTDYQTNYMKRLTELGEKYPAPYFIATDSAKTLADSRKVLGQDNVFSFAHHLSVDSSPIHRDVPKENAYQINADAILDLLMLALAKNYSFLELNENKNKVPASGFSLLANALHMHRPILNQLIDDEDPLIAQHIWPT